MNMIENLSQETTLISAKWFPRVGQSDKSEKLYIETEVSEKTKALIM